MHTHSYTGGRGYHARRHLLNTNWRATGSNLGFSIWPLQLSDWWKTSLPLVATATSMLFQDYYFKLDLWSQETILGLCVWAVSVSRSRPMSLEFREIIHHANQSLYGFHIRWSWHVSHCLNFTRVDFQSISCQQVSDVWHFLSSQSVVVHIKINVLFFASV